MLKKLFTTALLLFITSTTANAAFIDGSFGVFGTASTTLNSAGEVVSIDFSGATLAATNTAGDYTSVDGEIYNVLDPLVIADLGTASPEWIIDGFSFYFTSVAYNATSTFTGTDLVLIGNVSGNGFDSTATQWILSSQNLVNDQTVTETFSIAITSPAPGVSVSVPEPTTLAIFAFGLIGFAASRKKKSA